MEAKLNTIKIEMTLEECQGITKDLRNLLKELKESVSAHGLEISEDGVIKDHPYLSMLMKSINLNDINLPF